MSDWQRVEKYLGRDALDQLAHKAVAVVGVGSGGGFVALSLAMSGVGRFVLIDDDTLEAHNVVRHVADRRYIGDPKVHAVAELIRQRNPIAEVETVVGRLEDNLDRITNVDLVVVGVDGERPKYEINSLCHRSGLVAVYGGVYERGEGGDVVVIRPTPDSPCYACWAARLREDIADVIPGETELDYGMVRADGTIAAEPGLWIHVVRVAATQADIALNELLVGQPIHRTYPANTVILANVEMEIFQGMTVPPYSAQWINVERDPHCLVCGDRQSTHELSLDDLAGDLLTEEPDDEDREKQDKQEKL